MSKKARLRGGPPSPWGLGSLNANSIPSLRDAQRQRGSEHRKIIVIIVTWTKQKIVDPNCVVKLTKI